MGRHLFKKIPENWYQHELRFSLELLETYVQNIEQEIRRSIEEFKNGKEATISTDTADEFGNVHIYSVYKGLDSETWHLDTIFLDYFPNLKRRSAFITLYSFFEHELESLCDLYIKTASSHFEHNESKHTGIEKSISFLSTNVKLPIDKGNNKWHAIKSLQKIRNLIVHNGGKLTDRNHNIIESAAKIVNGHVHLCGTTEILLLDSFLMYTLDTIRMFLRYLDELIQENQKSDTDRSI